jgi:hypothetical protein
MTTTQNIFLTNIVTLMDSVYSKPSYSVNIDHHVDVTAGPTEEIAKLRQSKLSLNINLFKDAVYLTETSDYAELGQLWKSLHPLNVWGGDFGYGCIFSMSQS